MRRLSLNLLTGSVTALVLALLTLPAIAVRERAGRPPSLPVPSTRAVGTYVDPWHIDDWSVNVGATPTIAAKFEAFWLKRTVTKFMDEAERKGIKRVLVSWEPWKPVPTRLGVFRVARPQPRFTNRALANGVQDRYIRRFARSLTTFDGVVYLRFAHEMNGFWYPWSHDPRGYRRAWRHVVEVFRQAGARNVRFVWSVNPSLYQAMPAWIRQLRLYWPGKRYVDMVGATVINFGGSQRYGITAFAPRLRTLHHIYGKPVFLTEVNTQYGGRVRWLQDLRRLLRGTPWIKALAWSQLPSRGAAQMIRLGDLHWDVQRDPKSAAVLRGIIEDGFANRAGH
jgi:mannan endo-1,4-beta-mannosidase